MKIKRAKATDEPFIKLSDKENGKVYVINHYDKSTKRYSISPVDNVNVERFVKPDKEVFVDFEY